MPTETKEQREDGPTALENLHLRVAKAVPRFQYVGGQE
jgi:hypothetical protein